MTCPTAVPYPQRLADTEPVTAALGSGYRDFSFQMGVGRPADMFTLTISSVGADPLTIAGVSWAGLALNNLRRIGRS